MKNNEYAMRANFGNGSVAIFRFRARDPVAYLDKYVRENPRLESALLLRPTEEGPEVMRAYTEIDGYRAAYFAEFGKVGPVRAVIIEGQDDREIALDLTGQHAIELYGKRRPERCGPKVLGRLGNEEPVKDVLVPAEQAAG